MTSSRETIECPYCAEKILAKAIKCKHCKSSIAVAETPTSERSYTPPPVTVSHHTEITKEEHSEPVTKESGAKTGCSAPFIILIVANIAFYIAQRNGIEREAPRSFMGLFTGNIAGLIVTSLVWGLYPHFLSPWTRFSNSPADIVIGRVMTTLVAGVACLFFGCFFFA